jgi:catechol 2,3-dioxygenase-like lactoylglutathione lyase family enzyme
MINIAATLEHYIIGLQHIGHVVSDLDVAVANFERVYGIDRADVRWEPAAGVDSPSRFAFVTVAGTEFELIEASDPGLRAVIEKYPSGGAGINHVAWRVENLEALMGVLAEKGIVPGHVTPNGPVRFGHKALVYLDPDTTGGVLIELIEVFA